MSEKVVKYYKVKVLLLFLASTINKKSHCYLNNHEINISLFFVVVVVFFFRDKLKLTS